MEHLYRLPAVLLHLRIYQLAVVFQYLLPGAGFHDAFFYRYQLDNFYHGTHAHHEIYCR